MHVDSLCVGFLVLALPPVAYFYHSIDRIKSINSPAQSVVVVQW